LNTQEIMSQLAAELKKSKPNQKLVDQLNKKLDQALGTELKDEDKSLAKVWENSRR
jgi:hypothetical protein